LTFGSFIVGFPGETDATLNETVQFIRETKPTYYRSQLWYNEPGTPIDRERSKFQIVGDGFVWSHATMDGAKAMDHIDRMLLSIKESVWLPQWSFDFWIIPYFLGKGMSPDQLKRFVRGANKLLALEVANPPQSTKRTVQQAYLRELVNEIEVDFPHP
jgi:p-methyltransferase